MYTWCRVWCRWYKGWCRLCRVCQHTLPLTISNLRIFVCLFFLKQKCISADPTYPTLTDRNPTPNPTPALHQILHQFGILGLVRLGEITRNRKKMTLNNLVGVLPKDKSIGSLSARMEQLDEIKYDLNHYTRLDWRLEAINKKIKDLIILLKEEEKGDSVKDKLVRIYDNIQEDFISCLSGKIEEIDALNDNFFGIYSFDLGGLI